MLFIMEEDTVKKAEETDSIAVDLANGWNNMIWKNVFTALGVNENIVPYISKIKTRTNPVKIGFINYIFRLLFLMVEVNLMNCGGDRENIHINISRTQHLRATILHKNDKLSDTSSVWYRSCTKGRERKRNIFYGGTTMIGC